MYKTILLVVVGVLALLLIFLLTMGRGMMEGMGGMGGMMCPM